MILAKAMRLAANAESGPCEITADLWFPTFGFTMSIDTFSDTYLRSAIDGALTRRGPLATAYKFRRSLRSDEVCQSGEGIAGRLRSHYDVNKDMMNTRIDIRVLR
jgi:hypothetical protein